MLPSPRPFGSWRLLLAAMAAGLSGSAWTGPLAADAAANPSGWVELGPPQRFQSSAVYDPIRDRLILIGGTTKYSETNDAWTLDRSGPPVWTKLTPDDGSMPHFMPGHCAVFDSLRDRVIVIGAAGIPNFANEEAWELSLGGPVRWTKLPSPLSGQADRRGATAVLDTRRDRVLFFGGWRESGLGTWYAFNDLWALNLSPTLSWEHLSPQGPLPPGRGEHVAIYDPARDRMIIHGGVQEPYTFRGPLVTLNETWELTLDPVPTWRFLPPAPSSAIPPAREEHVGVYDAALDRMLIFGGTTAEGALFGDTWALSLADTGQAVWTDLAAGPQARYQHAAAYDRRRHQMLMTGGVLGYQYPNYQLVDDVWTYGGGAGWNRILPVSGYPSPRNNEVLALDTFRQRMIVLGGNAPENGLSLPNDIWARSLTGNEAWERIAGTMCPDDRTRMGIIYDAGRDRLVMFGGQRPGETGYFNDLYALPLSGGTCDSLAVTGQRPPARGSFTTIYDPVGQRMILFGGSYSVPSTHPSAVYLADVWSLALSGAPAWTPIVPTGPAPRGRRSHVAVYDDLRHRMVITGGADSLGTFHDTWALSLDGTPSWTQLTPAANALSSVIRGVYDSPRDRLIVTTTSDSIQVWALPLAAPTTWTRISSATAGPTSDFEPVFDAARDRILGWGGYTDHETWAMYFDLTTPVQVSLVEATAESDRALIRWLAPGASTARVYRKEAAGSWVFLVEIPADGTGQITYEDRDVRPGNRYSYRLGIMDGDREVFGGETSVDIPLALRLRLDGAQPNPARGSLRVAFSLPPGPRATLELFDLTGRRVLARDLGAMTPGAHLLALASPGTVRPGLYWLRLTQAGQSRAARVVVLGE